MAFGKFMRFQITVGAARAVVTDQTSVSHDGVTFTFDRPVPVGYFVTGWPFVLSTTGFAITAISPASGDLNGDGFIGNGAMLNPYFDGSDPQGFEEMIANATGGAGYAQTAYDNTANVDPAVSGSLAIAQGQKGTVVKTVRRAGAGTGDWQKIDRYIPLTILDEAPPADAYRPGMSGTTKRIRRRSDIDFTPRGFAPPAGFDAPATALAKVPPILGVFGPNGEKRRQFRTDVALGTTSSNYSADIVSGYAQTIYLANAAIDEGVRQSIIDRIAEHANDLESLVEEGWRPQGGRGWGAGQGGGVQSWLFAGAALFRDEGMLAAANAIETNMLSNAFWASAADVGLPAPGKQGIAAQTYFPEHVGIPHIEPDEFGSHHGARYLHLGGKIAAWENLAILGFDQGPASRPSGYDMLVDGGPFDATNQRAAPLAFLSRWYSWNPSTNSAHGPASEWRTAWDQIVPLAGFTPWSGPPDQPPMGDASILNDDYFLAGAGRVTLSVPAGFDYATEPVTRADLRYSLDGVQWVEVRDVSPPHIVDGLLKGANHWFGWRRVSASGTSPWSANFPEKAPMTSGSDRGKRLITGTDVPTAPQMTLVPAIHRRIYPDWDYPTWEVAPATLGLNDEEVAAGVGYWRAYPAPAFTYQWRRNGVDIVGVTDKVYRPGPADEGQTLTCRITAANASGSVTVETAPVTIPLPVGAHVPQAAPTGITGSGSALSSHTLTDVALGPGHPDRWIVLLVGGMVNAGGAFTSVTLDGSVSFVKLAEAYPGTLTGLAQVWVSERKVPTGTTGTITLASSGGTFLNYRLDVVRLRQAGDARTPLDVAVQPDVTVEGVEIPLDLTVAQGGFAVVAGQTMGNVGGQSVTFTPDIAFSGAKTDLKGADIYNAGGIHTLSGLRRQSVRMGQPGRLNAVAVSWPG